MLLASAQEACIGKREVPAGASDDNVVHYVDAEELAGVGQTVGDGTICLTGLGVTTGVVVAAKNGGSIRKNGGFKDFARMHDTGSQAPHGHRMDADDVIFLIEHAHDKVFTVNAAEVGCEHPGCIGRTPELVLIARELSFPSQHHAINRQGLLTLVPLLQKG